MIELSSDILSSISEVFTSFLTAPFKNAEMLWMAIPLVITMFVMEFYLAKYKHEDIGWNTATTNSLVLIFVAIDLFRLLHNRNQLSFIDFGSYAFGASLLVFVVLLEGLFLFFLNFRHLWPKFLAVHISSPITINLSAYIFLVIIYTEMELSPATFIPAILFFFLFTTLFMLLRALYPSED